MDILTLGHELLRQKAEPVKIFDAALVKTAEEMIEALHEGRGVGLAGPQVGLLKRIFVVHVEADDPRVFINPSIIETSPETVKYEEGCLSIPGVWADVIRPGPSKSRHGTNGAGLLPWRPGVFWPGSSFTNMITWRGFFLLTVFRSRSGTGFWQSLKRRGGLNDERPSADTFCGEPRYRGTLPGSPGRINRGRPRF
jgi:hypothetical protein